MSGWWETRPGYGAESSGLEGGATEAGMRIDIYHHFVSPDLTSVVARLDRLQRDVSGLLAQGEAQMSTTKELVDIVTALAASVAPLPDAVNALEAAVTAAAAGGGMSVEDQANLDAAVAALKDVQTNVAAAVADATDGVDEAKPTE